MNQKSRVRDQFQRHAKKYTTSQVHAGGESLDRLIALAGPQESDLVIDIATGAGFTACALAPFAHRVIAGDITPAMLTETRALAEWRQLTNVTPQYADAEAMPFHDGAFELVVCRTAPHHFGDPALFLQEAHRVLKPDGRLVVSDTCSPDDEEVEDWMHRVELLRDPTHVRNYRIDEWRTMAENAGLIWETYETGLRQPMDFSEWVIRSGTDKETVETLQHMIKEASPAIRETFQIEFLPNDFRLSWTYVVFRARKTK